MIEWRWDREVGREAELVWREGGVKEEGDTDRG